MRLLGNIFSWKRAPSLPAAQKADILRILLLVVSTIILTPLTDASRIYHSIRGQDTIKLYVIFNALEVSYALVVPRVTVILIDIRLRTGCAHL